MIINNDLCPIVDLTLKRFEVIKPIEDCETTAANGTLTTVWECKRYLYHNRPKMLHSEHLNPHLVCMC